MMRMMLILLDSGMFPIFWVCDASDFKNLDVCILCLWYGCVIGGVLNGLFVGCVSPVMRKRIKVAMRMRVKPILMLFMVG